MTNNWDTGQPGELPNDGPASPPAAHSSPAPGPAPTASPRRNTGWIIGIIAAVIVSGGIGIFAGIQIENNRIRSALSDAFSGLGSRTGSGFSGNAFDSGMESTAPPPVNENGKVGDTLPLPTGERITVHAVNRGVPPEQYSSDESPRTAIDVEFCAGSEPRQVYNQRWSVLDPANGRYEPELFSIDAPKPEYPSSLTPVNPGECLRGWILMDIPPAGGVNRVRYSLDDGTTLTWSNA